MNPANAEFQIGDWSKPHKLKTEAVKDEPDLATVSCACGWSVMTGADMAQRLGKIHIDRAHDKAQAARS